MIRLLCVLALMFLGSVANAQCPGGICYPTTPQYIPQYQPAVYYQPMYYPPPVYQQVIQYPQQMRVVRPVVHQPPVVQYILYLPF